MTGKVSIEGLAEILVDKFAFNQTESVLFSRYLIE